MNNTKNPAILAHLRWLDWARENYDNLSEHHKQIVDEANKQSAGSH